jgi:hypothetical protein
MCYRDHTPSLKATRVVLRLAQSGCSSYLQPLQSSSVASTLSTRAVTVNLNQQSASHFDCSWTSSGGPPAANGHSCGR